MNLDSLSFSLIHIGNLVTNLNKKNFKPSIQEITQLIEVLGVEAQTHLLSCLFSHVDLEAGKSSLKENPHLQCLQQQCAALVTRPNFVRVVCYVVDHPAFKRKYRVPQFLGSLSRTLKLNRAEEVAFGIALLHSRDPECRQHAELFVQHKLPDLIKSYIDSADATGAVDEGGLHESSPELLHQLVSWLLYAPPEQLDKAADSQEGFLEAIRKDFPRELVPVVLAPLIYPESTDLPPDKIHTPVTMANNLLDGSLSDFVLETGYTLCSSVDECRRQLAGHGVAELTAAGVARVLGAMLRTYSGGLTDQIPIQSLQNVASIWGADSGGSAAAGKEGAQTWNVEVFVRAVHELVPGLQWNEVVYHLDHPGFQVPDRTALRLLTQALQLGLQLQAGRTDHFPVETLYRVWKNADSQLSYINQTLKNSDVFCLADYHCHMVDVAQLKVVPDKDNKDISTWRCTELSQLLLHLADSGHSCAVQELLKFPVQNCPDILMLNLLASGSNSHLSQELLSNLFFVFLAGHHPNSSAVLHQAWHTTQNAPSVHGMIIHAMAEWYRQAESDQTRLSRILDVAQDLKALSLLLNYQAFAFVIDLACLASRREYLKLDKWISDKIHEHGEPFLTACVKFLQRRVPQLASGPGALKDLEPPPPSSAPLPAALVAGMLNVLHSRASTPSAGVSADLSDAILTMVGNAGQLMMGRTAGRPQGAPLGQQQGPPTAPPPPGVVRPSRGLESAFGPSPLSSQLFPSQSADLLVSGLSAGIGGLGLGGGGSSGTPGVSAANNGGSMVPSSGAGLAMSGSYASMSGVTTGSVLGGGVSVSRPGQQPHGLLGGPLASLSAGGSSAGLFPTAGAAGTSAGTQHALPARPSSQADMAIFQSDTTVLSREVEEEANSNFQRIYNHPPHPTLSIEEVLDMLKRFQDSSVSREREVFACMLRSLMDEYKFFPQYPDKELYITAQLFGGIIEHNLVTNYMGLGIALRYVLDAIKKPPGSKMYNFGIVALDRFKHRLREYPQYCQHLAAVEHFTQFPRHLVDYVECGIRSQEPLSRPEGPVLPPHLLAAVGDSGAVAGTGSGAATVAHVPPPSAAITAVVQQPPPASSQLVAPPAAAAAAPGPPVSRGPLPAGRPSIANTTNIETLVNALTEVIAPSDVVQDKIGFIFNNLSQINLPQKREDLLEVLEKDYFRWFAQYIVMRRVSIEPNFHTLYANFLDALKLPELMFMVVRELHRNIQVLMRADKGVEKFNDRTILKNLGHWLGLMTIAKNKPVLQIEIDVKALIVEAYHLGVHEMLYIVPFVAKIVESCAKSKIFKPPNPWTMGIMNLLAELHQEEDLKLNLKFEIEVLCKTLSLDVNELKPTNWLNDHMRLQTLPIQLKRPTPPAMTLSVMPPPPPPPAPAGFQTPTSGLMSASAAYQHQAVATAGGVYHSASALEEHMMSSSSQAPLAMPPTLAPPPPLSMPADGGQRPPVPPPAPPHPPPVASEPRFSFSDINTSSIAGLASHTTINNALPLFQSNPQLKHIVRPAVERTVQDWLPRSVERYCKLAVSTVEQIVKKDFALDPDEVKMRTAAHQMVMNLTAGLTLINCRDPLHLSISNNVKSALMATARAASQQHKDFIEQTAGLVAADNVELACCFIQKSVVERAIAEVDKRLATDYEARKLARVEGRRYVDPVAVGYQEARMPESIRLKPISQQQMAVYEEFLRVIPGFAGGAGGASTAVTSADTSQFLPGLPGTMTAPPLPMRATQPPPLRAAGLPTAATVAPQQLQQAAAGGDDMSVILDKLALELQSGVQSLHPAAVGTTQGQQISRLAEDVAVARGTRDVASHVHLIKLAVDGLLEYMSQLPTDPELALRFRDAHLLILRALQDPRVYGPHWVQKQVTSFVVDWRDDARLNADAVDALLRARLISIPQLDAHLSHAMETGNYSVVGLAMQLLQAFLVDERSTLVSECDLINTIEALSKIAQQQGCPENIGHLLELVRGGGGGGGAPGSAVSTVASHEMALTADRTPGGPTAHIHKGISQARDFDDPPGMQEKTEYLLREWVSLYHSPGSGRDSTKAFTNIVHQMNLQGILKTDDLITRFFRLSTQLCVDLCYRALNDPASGSPTLIRDKCFRTLDAFVRLIALLVKHSGESPHAVSKINLLNKVLGIVTGVLLQDHEVRKTEFQQLSYHRIFIMLLLELNAPETVLEAINFQVLTAFCNVLHILRPEKAPGFAYAWLDIVSHRVFIGRMLAVTPQHKGWGPYAQLLIDLFNFLSPFLRNAELAKPVTVLYKGCLRVLLVLLHDFPEFLCDYHYNFCDVIPPNCIQMRNLILSAFPRNMPPPDPFTSKLQVDMIPEIREAPMIQTNFASLIQPATFKNELDTYLSTRTPVTFVTDLRTTLQFSPEPGCHYSIKLMNALVLYVGTQAIGMIQSKGLQPTKQTIAHSAHMDIFQSLAVDLDTEGRYLFLNAIANQLRYPNSHTNYFLNLLLYLFAEANTSAIQEQITRVLLERLIVNRPHPWGLLITFIELIKNPSFKFWNHEFVHCAPEIEKLFDSVARSCVAQGQKVNALRAAAAASQQAAAAGAPGVPDQ